MSLLRWLRICGWAAGLLLWQTAVAVHAQEIVVTGQVEIVKANGKGQSDTKAKTGNAENVAIWLTPADATPEISRERPTRTTIQLVQKNKSFDPHLTVIEVGSVVNFPNKDPFFHNVFSLFNGKRFDLGLYEAGSSNSVHFDRAGISYLFCNIHPEMSGVVVVVPTPYFGVSNGAGKVTLANVPNGRYRLHVWYEKSSPEDLLKLERDVVISDTSRALEPIRVMESLAPNLAHKNKYGKDYIPAASPTYSHP
jgi:plastocyanin